MPLPFRPCFQLTVACKSRGHGSLGKMKGERSHAHDSTSNTKKYKKNVKQWSTRTRKAKSHIMHAVKQCLLPKLKACYLITNGYSLHQ